MQCAGLLLRGKFRSGQLYSCFVRFFFCIRRMRLRRASALGEIIFQKPRSAACSSGGWESFAQCPRRETPARAPRRPVLFCVQNRCRDSVPRQRLFVFISLFRNTPARAPHWEKQPFRSRFAACDALPGRTSLSVPGWKCPRGLPVRLRSRGIRCCRGSAPRDSFPRSLS